MDNIVRVKVFWTPLVVVLRSLKENLANFGIIRKITPKYLSHGGKVKIISSPISIDIELKDGVSREDIPKLFINQFGFKSYISIESNNRLCFNCLGDSHVCIDCPYVMCRKCGIGQPVDHVCRNSDRVVRYYFPIESTSASTSAVSNMARPNENREGHVQEKTSGKCVQEVSVYPNLKRPFEDLKCPNYDQFYDQDRFGSFEIAITEEDELQREQVELEEIRQLIIKEYNLDGSNVQSVTQHESKPSSGKRRKGRLK